MRERLNSMFGVGEPQTQGAHQGLKHLTVLTQVAEKLTQLDLDRFTTDQRSGCGAPGTLREVHRHNSRSDWLPRPSAGEPADARVWQS